MTEQYMYVLLEWAGSVYHESCAFKREIMCAVKPCCVTGSGRTHGIFKDYRVPCKIMDPTLFLEINIFNFKINNNRSTPTKYFDQSKQFCPWLGYFKKCEITDKNRHFGRLTVLVSGCITINSRIRIHVNWYWSATLSCGMEKEFVNVLRKDGERSKGKGRRVCLGGGADFVQE